MSVALPRKRPVAVTAAPTITPADVGRFAGWAAAALIVFASVYFHSKTDPGVRLAIKSGSLQNYGPAWWDEQKFGSFTPGDVAVFAFAYVGLILQIRRGAFAVSRRMALLGGLGAVAILLGVATGIYNHTTSPFGDWRNLAVGYLFALGLWWTVLRTERDCFRFAQIFVGILVAYGGVQLAEYAAGGGEIAFYGRTPTGDHATLEFMVAAVGISLAMLRTGRTRWLWWSAVAVGTAVVVLAFRRYAWVEIAVVFGSFLLFSGANRRKYLLGALGVLAAGAIAVGLTWSSLDWAGRLSSLNPTETRSQNVLATTNAGHLNDILDGLDQVRAHPLTGLGVGVLYHPTRSASWKGEAGMVHNAPIEVWIKFGILGLVVFVATYFMLFREIWRRRRGRKVSDLLAFGGGTFLLGNFVVIFSVYSWPFGAWEKGILIFCVIAMAFPPGWRSRAAARPAPA